MAQIRKRDLIRVLLRSFYIQSTWNAERLLGLGFCFSLIPVARRLFDNKEELVEFLQRHLEFFNSHPYLATFALGAITNIEEQAIVKKWEDKRPISVFKNRVIGPLGVIGDTSFWQLIRPTLGVLGIILLGLIGIWGSLFYLVAYNSAHFYVRIKGLWVGHAKGFDIVRILSFRGTQKYLNILKYSCAALFGAELNFLMGKVLSEPSSWRGLVVFLTAMVVSYLSVRRQNVSIDLLIIIIVCSSIIIGLII